MRRLFLILLAITPVWTAQTLSQGRTADIKQRLAESYERSGDLETAVKLFQEAYARDSSNLLVFEALRRDYLQLKMHDKAVSLLEGYLARNPKDINMLSQLAAVYVLKSDETRANEIWERAIAVDPSHEVTYRFVGSTMLQSRQFDRAINIYQRGRTACGDPKLFTSDIAYLYSVMLKYPEATREYLNLVRQNPPQLAYAESRISTYTGRAEGLSAATLVVEQAVKSEPENLPFQQLRSWVYMEGKHYDQAFEVYKIIDEKTKAQGHELFNFAMRALNERAYAAAAAAFTYIEKKYPAFDQMSQLKFGYARTLEEIDAQGDTTKFAGSQSQPERHPESQVKPLYGAAISAYERVIAEFPKTEIAARSLLRIATLKQERLFDLDGSRSALENITRTYGMIPAVAEEATLRLGDVYLWAGDMEKAAAQYKLLAGRAVLVNQLQETAGLRLAELDYFQKKFQDALTKLKSLTRNASSDVTNDALSLQIFIQENIQPGDAALKDYAQADLLRRQQKLPDALAAFQSIVQTYPKSDIVDDALVSTGDLLSRLDRSAEALAAYERLLKDFPESILLDRALMKMGEVYIKGMKDSVKAIAAYQRLLEQYPNSIYAAEARKRIRELRGDNI
ncbi:MAG TPA: tetratricopeptide repeat protein [Bacteroidota bacterium]|nr:tetratricopeptide repeat protein [Bacteroidota bacterium]